MSQKPVNAYFVLGILAVIWGSSFILMKEGLKVFNSIEVATMRIAIAGIVFIPLVKWRKLNIKKSDYKYFIISGFLGSAIPAYLFTAAQTHISSSLAGAINGMTPLFAVIVGVAFLGVRFNRIKVIGVVLGLMGAISLILGKNLNFDFQYSLLAVLAAVCYGINVNIIKEKLGTYPPLIVTAVPLAVISIFACGYLFYLNPSNDIVEFDSGTLKSIGAIVLLAVLGTSFSLMLFNRLIQQTSTLFATSVTYLIPIVAMFWGFLDNEVIGINHIAGLGFILVAIWLIRNEK
jgi:drug/metabolite transporter (DMT)-like permease